MSDIEPQHDVIIDPEFRDLIPPQNEDELKGLEESLLKDGFHEWEPLVVWKEEQILVDGHHRHKLCIKHNIPFKVVERSFVDRNEAILEALRIQLNRRNIPSFIRVTLTLRYKERIAAKAKENERLGGKGSQKSVDLTIDTQKELAKMAGVSHDTISKVEAIEKDAPEELKNKVKSGEISINAAATTLKTLKKFNGTGALFTSDSEEWYTPPEIIEAVVQTFGEIDLDPCSNSQENPNIPAKHHYTKEDDGLKKEWFGKVYMNPPYGREVKEWVQKIRDEYRNEKITDGIVLVAARTDTEWFNILNDFLWCAIKGRLTFSNCGNNAPFPSAVFYLGENIEGFYGAFSKFGPIYRVVDVEEVIF